MSDADAPRWELLPHDPQGFFGLDDGFDRKDLKRAYNGFLKRFKPERFPDEFQRIRAAFEALDDRLRYGIEMPQTAPIGISTGGAREPETVERGPILAQLEAEGAERAFATRERDPRTAQDYYELAVLSDVVPGPRRFHQWLLEGLRACGRDMRLLALLNAWAHEPRDADELVESIRAVARLRDPSAFGFATERMWQQLVARTPFERVSVLLDESMRTVGSAFDPSWLPLMTRFVRAAIFAADEAWIEARIAELEELAIASQLEVDAEFNELDVLRRYRSRVPEADARATPLRQSIDDAIRALVTEDEANADRRLLALLFDLQDAGDQVVEEFGYRDQAGQAMAHTLELLAYDARDRLGLAMPDTEFAPKALREQLRRLESRADSCGVGLVWNGWNSVEVMLPIACFVAAVYFATGLDTWLAWLVGIGAGAGVIFYWRSGRHHLDFDGWFGRLLHRRHWRREWVRFLGEHPMPVGYIVSATPHVRPENTARWAEIAETIAEDPGLWLFALARRVG